MTSSWATADRVTNANLTFLASLADARMADSADEFLNLIRALIGVVPMLPAAVRQHLRLPNLYVGDGPTRWSPDILQARTAELTYALRHGLEAIAADTSLQKGGSADLSDRPASRGEEVATAIAIYRDRPGSDTLSDLQHACSVEGLSRYPEQLRHWLGRKRPSSPHRTIEYEIACVLGEIARRADDYHHLPASLPFREQNRPRISQV